MAKPGTITIENAEIMFLNFAGREGTYNEKGKRNFCVILDEDLAETLAKDGWNVKRLNSKDDDNEDLGAAYIQVTVRFDTRPPRINWVTSKGRSVLGEDECEVIDYADLKNVDLIINPHTWSVNGKSGVKAYLKNGFFTLDEDELDKKYADVPEVDGAYVFPEEEPDF